MALFDLAAALYPICRSITGDGVRRSLALIGQITPPMTVHEVPTGTPVLDWTVPNEWTIRDAYVKNMRGERVIDFQQHTLHVLNYSAPVNRRMPLDELRAHLFTLPDQPDLIPYRTSYYKETWGFCMRHADAQRLEPGDYDVHIDSTLAPGHLSYGEIVLPGEQPDEVLISCHVCHPSLANDNLSGITVAAHLAAYLAALPERRLTYRFLFIPGTIGSITWLARNPDAAARVKHGLVVTGVGDSGGFTYKRSRRGDAHIDRVMSHVLASRAYTLQDYIPYGYDERQFCSPGFNLPVGCLMRSGWGAYPQYHTSADNLSLISESQLQGSLDVLIEAIEVLERDVVCVNQKPHGEPMLGKRGLYNSTGAVMDKKRHELALLWVLSYSDGSHSLLDIAERAGVPFGVIRAAADALLKTDLLVEQRGQVSS
jgi:aminopeptidase-like protein